MQKETPKKSKFAINLGKLRKERGLSQRQAAALLGVSQALLSHYETDAREPKLDFVIKICDYYSVTTDYILGRTKERNDGASRLSTQVNEIINSLDEIRANESELLGKLKTLVEQKKPEPKKKD